MKFYSYSGSGNNFLIATISSDELSMLSRPNYISKISALSTPAADGILYLERKNGSLPGAPDLKMHYFNRDGSRASMCGNGLRAIARYAFDTTENLPHRYAIETDCGIRAVEIHSDGTVEVDMGTYPYFPLGSADCSIQEMWVPLDEYGAVKRQGFFTSTGVPHIIFFSSNVEKEPVAELGRKVRYSSHLQPHGANVNFVEAVSTPELKAKIRTYERGVEAETGACGTGACALFLTLLHLFPSNQEERIISILFHSGEEAEIKARTCKEKESLPDAPQLLRLFMRAPVKRHTERDVDLPLESLCSF